ncbi:hypothetical protein [Pseudomonas plecoglossicida]
MRFTQSHHSIDQVVLNFEALMSHLQSLMNKGGQTKSIKNTKFGELHEQLLNINSLSDEEVAALALTISNYNQVNHLFDGSLDISFHEHEILDLITGQPILDGSNDKSTDRLFELCMAIRFARGLRGKSKIDLATECDIVVDAKLAIECKNIQSAKKAKSRVKYASDQLKRRFDQGVAKYGFIAVDVSALIDRNRAADYARFTFERFEESYSYMARSGSFAPAIRERGVLGSIESDSNFRKIVSSYLAHQAEFALHSNLGDFRLEDLPGNCWGIIIQSTVPVSISDTEKMVPIPVRTTSYFLNPSFPEELKSTMRDFISQLSTGF